MYTNLKVLRSWCQMMQETGGSKKNKTNENKSIEVKFLKETNKYIKREKRLKQNKKKGC